MQKKWITLVLMIYSLRYFLEIPQLLPVDVTMGQLMMLQFVMDCVLSLVIIKLLRRWEEDSILHFPKLKLSHILICIVSFYFLDCILPFIVQQIPQETSEEVVKVNNETSLAYYLYSIHEYGNWMFPLVMAEICIFGPIFEELLYRGLIMTQFFKNSPLYLDVLLSAIIFSLSHLIISHLSLLDFLIYFNIGLVFALIFRKTKNIYYSVMLHMVVNIAASIPELKSIYVYVKFWIVMTFF